MFTLLENAIASRGIEFRHFYSCPPGKSLPKVLIITPRQWENTHHPSQHFFKKICFPQQKEERGNNDQYLSSVLKTTLAQQTASLKKEKSY